MKRLTVYGIILVFDRMDGINQSVAPSTSTNIYNTSHNLTMPIAAQRIATSSQLETFAGPDLAAVLLEKMSICVNFD